MSAAERPEPTDAALAAALEERNRLWSELQAHRAREHEVEELRVRLAGIEGSAWWRAGKPLRLARRAAQDPTLAAKVLLGYLRILRARLGR